MPQYHIITYGCQMNKSDSERIATLLERKGYQPAEHASRADLVIINMCSVRQKAVEKVKNQIARLRPASWRGGGGRVRPKIILTGCILEADEKGFEKLGVEIKKFKGLYKIKPKTAFVPIANGCNNFCTYCVVPYTRGQEQYRDKKQILCEVKRLLKKGLKEIMLLGQNVNSYPDFVGLLRNITALKGDFKVKFITNHPKDFFDELIKEMAGNEKIARYIHLPLQSGDNKILRKMNRKYTREYYLALVKKIKKKIPEIELTTDVIVGFPGETKKQFQNTVKLFKQVKFANAYVAKYSPRPGTAAYHLRDDVPLAEKQRREKVLRDLLRRNDNVKLSFK